MNAQRLDIIATTDDLSLDWIASDIVPTAQVAHLERDLFERFTNSKDNWLLALGFCDKEIELPPVLAYWRDFAGFFVESLIHQEDLETKRDAAQLAWPENYAEGLLANAPMFTGCENLSSEFLARLWHKLNKAYETRIKSYNGSVASFVHSFCPKLHLAGRVFFHLVENKKGEMPFAFLATYSQADGNYGSSRHWPLKFALKEHEGAPGKLLELLTTVYRAAKESALVSELIESGELFHPLNWGNNRAYRFLLDVPIFERAGVLCRIPNWWSRKSASVSVGVSIGKSGASLVGISEILGCKPHMSVGGVEISGEEAENLLAQSDGLSLLKNRWVAVDKEKLKQALEVYKKAESLLLNGGLRFSDVMSLHLSPSRLLGSAVDEVSFEVTQDEWFRAITTKLRNPSIVDNVTAKKGFVAELRPYQQAGLNWLGLLDGLGIGGCLADDMGLGKTVQILAFLSYKRPSRIRTLLVVPASLIGNWTAEIARFLPELKYIVAHPQYTPGDIDVAFSVLDDVDLVITTYAMTQRYEGLKSYLWDYIILDEAQAIKNPGTKQTKELKKYRANNRIILTGTPIENRLGDLWSLFDFLNPGLLGTISEFATFSKTLTKDHRGYGRLRKVIGPYILRRLKTDKSIIDDLPEKIEMPSYAELCKKQVVLYRALLADFTTRIEQSEGIERKGLILSSLMKFKQICNHPDQFLGAIEYEGSESGKFLRLREICETISEKRERVLVFTQFKEMCEPLDKFLFSVFGRPGLVLHGSVSVSKRKQIVEKFQSGLGYIPYMILSLKAGGVGLNLTNANHVVHFDRWWNPAIENQATDRAFRIGQRKNVVVHKFITKGTIEERINEMLSQKSKMSDQIINQGAEAKLTELKNEELLDLFKLRL